MSFYSAMPVLQVSNGPLYLQLERLLRDAISDGRLAHNDALPPERDMADHYRVSRLTVRKALSELERDRLLLRRRGAGTFVSLLKTPEAPPAQAFREDLLGPGRETHSVWLSRTVDTVTADEAMTFGVPFGTQVVRLHRLRYNADTPVSVSRSVVLRTCLTSELAVEDSLYEAMQQAGPGPSRALQRLCAVALPTEEAGLLDVPAGSPGLYTERRGFLSDGRPAELTRSWHRGDSSDLVTEFTVPRALGSASPSPVTRTALAC